uniref:Uncharacterized protein n=1 Tax=Parascaris univalens TaxID=6257 RepID=A0A914ZJ39_PARUN
MKTFHSENASPDVRGLYENHNDSLSPQNNNGSTMTMQKSCEVSATRKAFYFREKTAETCCSSCCLEKRKSRNVKILCALST